MHLAMQDNAVIRNHVTEAYTGQSHWVSDRMLMDLSVE